MLECNYLSLLVKPNYEKPVDTAQDVLDRGLTVIWLPGYEQLRETLRMRNLSKVTRDLAERTCVAKVRFIYRNLLVIFYYEILMKGFG